MNEDIMAAEAGKPARTLEVIGAEIRALTVAVAVNVIEIGRRLVEAKEQLPHGEFLNWVKENTGYSSSTANNYMTIYHRVANKQLSLFGAEVENFQAFGNLGYAKLIELTKIKSDEEMEEFVETHDVESMSTRELREAIRERDEARKALEETREELNETSEMLDKTLEERNARGVIIREHEESLAAMEKELAELKARPVEVAVQEPDPEEIEKRAQEIAAGEAEKFAAHEKQLKADAAAEKTALEEKLKKAQEKARAEREKLEAQLKEAEGKLAAAGEADKAEAEKLRSEAEALRKQLAMSSQEITIFKLRFSAWQEAYKLMSTAFEAIQDEETKEKMRAAIRAQVKAWGWGE